MFLFLCFFVCGCVEVQPIRHTTTNPLLSSRSFSGGKDEVTHDVTVTTEVVPVTLPPQLLKKFKKQYELFGDNGFSATAEYYEYTHTFTNKGPRKIDLGFPQQGTFSPFVSAMRGFSLSIPSGKGRTVRFIASSKPQESVTTMLVAIHYGRNKWFLSGGGAIAMYVPADHFTFSDKTYYPEDSWKKKNQKVANVSQKK